MLKYPAIFAPAVPIEVPVEEPSEEDPLENTEEDPAAKGEDSAE